MYLPIHFSPHLFFIQYPLLVFQEKTFISKQLYFHDGKRKGGVSEKIRLGAQSSLENMNQNSTA